MNKTVFKVASLGSGSKGNGTLVSAGSTNLLIDCGFTVKETLKRFAALEFSPQSLSAILVTHEHQDHIKGAGALSRRFNIPVFTTQGTFLSGKIGECDFRAISPFQHFSIDKLMVEAFSVPHDAREPCQFVLQYNDKRLAVVSDLGSITQPIIEKMQSCHALLLEMNHDYEMLMTGVYPMSLKRRVGGKLGHLNNQQSIELLKQLDFDRLELMVATHLSEQNNCPRIVESLLAETFENKAIVYKVANQEQGLDWIELAT
ncbi:MBL fold metallo-hydrolase [Kangiella sp. HZ709]|uniref:MBL fold metallo-hydrolase n=1 Tax=Kangiella sp. HZ709 TaxID=2666328 RepID=UPI0012B0037F|nr:MBL fold metallo-hydrolase [Kangiella sp. HZ709]MRX27070.1 MBL fold metallo-hydrolase [Kangiella sp. HZ709]